MKMMFLVTIFLIVIGGALSQDDVYQCLSVERKKCDISDRLQEFPQTPEQFESGCREVLKFFDCTKKVFEKCDVQGYEVDELRKTSSYMENHICNPESPLYEVASNNLQCIGHGIDDSTRECYRMLHSETESGVISGLEDFLNENVEDDETEEFAACMRRIKHTACQTAVLEEKCGSNVGELYLHAATNLDDRLQKCPEATLNQLPFIVMAALVELEKNVQNAIKKKK